MDNNNITGLKYNLEPTDHLYKVYGEFGRRNDINEWIYFFRRPEFADEKVFTEIAHQLLGYLVKYSNISQEIVKMIEDTFHFARDREKYERAVGYEAMETYCRYILGKKEFPPFELFEEYDEEKNYDRFIYEFREMFFSYSTEDPAEYRNRLDALKEMDIEHPYIAFLDSEYYVLCGEWNAAAESLKNIEDCYHKYMSQGFLFTRMGLYDMAEVCYEKAIEEQEANLDPALVIEYLRSKWETGKEADALFAAERFEEAGYGHVVMPMKQMFLTELGKAIMEKGESQELSEGELILLKEMYKSYGDFESVRKLADLSWKKGFEDESWTIDMAEACFETGDFDQAQQIIDMVYDGRKQITSTGRIKIRELKARLLFKQGRIGDAYEIMENICSRLESTVSQKYTLAGMYLTTGKFKSASNLLSKLRYEASSNFFYTYDLAMCCMKLEEYEKAIALFMEVYSEIPEFGRTAFHIVECAVELRDDKEVKQAMNIVKGNLSYYEIRYFNGLILEMNEEYKEARETYKKLIDEYKEEMFPEQLLYDLYVRYFLMVAETNGRVGAMVRDMQEVLSRYPKAAELWIYLAEFQEATEYMEENIKHCYEMALKADPFNVNALLGLINVYIEADNSKKIWELSNRLVECTDKPEGYLLRAQSGYDVGKTEECLNDLNKYEQMGGSKNDVIDTRADIALMLGDYEEAYKGYEEKLKNKKPEDIPCYDSLALCMCKLGRYQEAVDILDIACETSMIGDHHVMLYKIQMYMGDFGGAKETLKRYSKMFDINKIFDDDYTILSAWLHTEAAEVFKAESIAESIASREGERLCAIHEILHMNFKKAAKLFKKLVKKEPDEVENYMWYALTLHLCGSKADAEACAKQGLEIFKREYGDIEDLKAPYFLCQYAFLKVLYGENEEAVEMFNKALSNPTCKDYPCSACYEAHYGLGINHLLNGNKQGAKEEFDAALKIKPANIVCRNMSELV